MENLPHTYKGKKVTVIGLARSGASCAMMLRGQGAIVTVTELRDDENSRLAASKLRAQGITCELGKNSEELIRNCDILVTSPGVSEKDPPLALARKSGVKVISEIEAAYSLCRARIIAVTGSNGKTTVTTLIGKVIEKSGRKAFVCGNIGIPFSCVALEAKENDYICLEVSSFQLENIDRFRPLVSVIINFSPNHLDRHKDMKEYLDAKKRIFMNQGEDDWLVLNGSDPALKGLEAEAKARTRFFGGEEGFNPNQSAVVAVASLLGIDSSVCRQVFAEFRGIEHRMESVAEINKVIFINDSKATTADSAAWALRSIDKPVLWIAGGRHKGIDYSGVLGFAKDKVKRMFVIGEAREKIKQALGSELDVSFASGLEEAVCSAFESASAGDCVLLSPMCSSYDMFSDYEHRGREYKRIVETLYKKAQGCAK